MRGVFAALLLVPGIAAADRPLTPVQFGRERLQQAEDEIRVTARRHAAETGATRAVATYCLAEVAERLAALEARSPDGPFSTRPAVLATDLGQDYLRQRVDYALVRFQLCLAATARELRDAPPLRREGPPR